MDIRALRQQGHSIKQIVAMKLPHVRIAPAPGSAGWAAAVEGVLAELSGSAAALLAG